MQRVTIDAAKTHLSRLIEAALAGEDVVITHGSTPAVRLVPIAKQTFKIGLLAGQLGKGPDFLAPLDDAELNLWEGLSTSTVQKTVISLLVGVIVCMASSATVCAQGLPTDTQVQAAFGTVYNHLGLMEYCAARQYASAADVANTRKTVKATVAGMTVGAAALAQEAVGRRGDIVGEQLIGLMDLNNPAHPEMVPAGRTMSLADNARAQNTSERTLCGQMAAQVAPLP